MEQRCVVVYKKLHGKKVVTVAVLQSGPVSDAGFRDSQVFTFVCSVNYANDALLDELVKAGGRTVVEALTPLQLSETAICQLPAFPAEQDKANYQLYVDGWVNSVNVDVEAIALAAVTQASTLEGLGVKAMGSWPSELVGETLVAGCFGAWAFAKFNGHIPRPLALRRPLVRVIELLMPLVGGLNNNVKIYGDALGFSGPKAHKDVRTYRETLRRMEQESLG
jgi:hypothetical protein